MVSFLGTSTHTLDDKCRLIVPKRFMDEIPPKFAAKFAITASLDGCLLLMDYGSWEETVNKFSAEVVVDSHQRAVRRVFLGHADIVDADRNARISINESLRLFVGLEPNASVVLVGTGKCIEVWTPQAWSAALAKARLLNEFFETQVDRPAGVPA